MFVNGVRVMPHEADRFSVAALNEHGVLESTRWRTRAPDVAGEIDRMIADGQEVFRIECASCHTRDGYLAIRPLVRGASSAALHAMTTRLDRWRGRRMPPFVGTPYERQALATYLAIVGGASPDSMAAAQSAASSASAHFDENCSLCHGTVGEFPFDPRGRSPDEFYRLLGQLPQVNDVMAPFEGSDELRRALADHLAGLPAPSKETER